jgi:very-short-patch-repair endonuclease
MDPQNDHSAATSVWALARRQYGVVAHEQLLSLGLSDWGIRHRVAHGRLHRLWKGVYAVGRPELTVRGRWMAALLSCGHSAVLSHRSAAALWGIGSEKQMIEVSVRTCLKRDRSRVRVHRRAGLRDFDLTVRGGIPVTSPIRTLIDLAASSGPDGIERTVNEADRLDLVDPETLRRSLGAYRGQRGVARLRAVLEPRSFRRTDSGLERRFLRLVRDAGLPTPLTQRHLNGFRVDFFWPELGLVVETDGFRYHRTAAQQAEDRIRDQVHAAAGMTALRFAEEQVRFEPRRVSSVLADVVRRLEGSRRASVGPA